MDARIESVVVGFDFSPASVAALEAAALVEKGSPGAHVYVVTSVHGAARARIDELLREFAPPSNSAELALDLEDRLDAVERMVAAAISDVGTWGAEIAVEVTVSSPSDAILAAAERHRANLIVVGSYGQTAPRRGHELGLDAERLARTSPQPVLVVDPVHPFPPKKILCAIDYSKASERALHWSVLLARTTGAELTLLHVAEPGEIAEARIKGAEDDAALLDLASDHFSEFLSRFDFAGVDLYPALVDGRPSKAILETARVGGFDLIAIGTLNRSHLLDLLVAHTAERVIRHTPASLLAVKPGNHHT